MHVFGHNLFKAQGFNDKSDIPSSEVYGQQSSKIYLTWREFAGL